MGGKPDHALKADRPETGGADKDMIREKSGLLELDKAKFAQMEQEKNEDAPEQQSTQTKFSIDNEPNSDPRK
jgi:hypothetical protein